MVPSPDILFPVSTFLGDVQLSGTWPGGLPLAITLNFQYWVRNPSGPQGFSVSNAVAGTSP
jgi:hypothetical protein